MNDLSRLHIDRMAGAGAGAMARRPRRRWWPGLLVIGIGLGVYFRTALLAHIAAGPIVELGQVASVYPAQSLAVFNATGYVVPETKADIASKATGRLESLTVEEGSPVRRGQIIAQLENADVKALLARARASLAATQAVAAQLREQLAESRTRVDAAQAEREDALRGLARARAMVSRRFVTPEVYDAAVTRADKAGAAYAGARAGVSAAQAGVIAAEAQITASEAAVSEAQVNLEYTYIRAPFDGVILSKHADIGDVVAPFAATLQSKGSVVSMADLGSLQVEADVSEANLTRVQIGQPCEIELDALPDTRLRGQVHMVVPTIDRTRATVLVKVRFVDRDPRLLPDMSARVVFLKRALDDHDRAARTVVPPGALIEQDARVWAWRYDGERVHRVAVTIGAMQGDQRVVFQGLVPGDRVVLNPPAALADGAQVQPAAKP